MTKTVKQFEDSNQRLFDLLFRHQIYLEGLKVGMSSQYVKMLKKLYLALSLLLIQSRYATLDQLTRIQLLKFIQDIQKTQLTYYNTYVNELVNQLKDFVAVEVDLQKSIFSDVKSKNTSFTPMYGADAVTGSDKANASLWEQIDREPMPANGQFVSDNFKAFTAAAMNNIAAIVRQGYANGWTPQQTLAIIGGDGSPTFKGGVFGKLLTQNAALVATALQHFSSNVQAAIATEYYKKYQWVSVMDTHTTPVCVARNGVVYIYGKGPLPPAWYNCRSKTIPYDGEPIAIPKSYLSWFEQQSEEFKSNIGPVTSESLRNIGTVNPLTLEEFAAKIKYILS
jgi:hypothetical protein